MTLWAKVFNAVQLLWWLSVVAESALLFTLLRRKLYRVYILFTTYLGADIVRSVGMMWLVPDTNSKAYARVWSVTEPALVLMQVAFAVELYVLISRHYRNFERMRSYLFWSSLGAALGISLLVVSIDKPVAWSSPLIQSIVLGKRVATFALAGFVVGVAIFLRIFRIPMRQNVTFHRRIATVYFLANATHYFAIRLAPSIIEPANVILMILSGGCFCAWILCLKPAGEGVEALPEPSPKEIEAHVQRGAELVRRVGSIKP